LERQVDALREENLKLDDKIRKLVRDLEDTKDEMNRYESGKQRKLESDAEYYEDQWRNGKLENNTLKDELKKLRAAAPKPSRSQEPALCYSPEGSPDDSIRKSQTARPRVNPDLPEEDFYDRTAKNSRMSTHKKKPPTLNPNQSQEKRSRTSQGKDKKNPLDDYSATTKPTNDLGNTGLRVSRIDSFGVGSFDNNDDDPMTVDDGSQSRSPKFPINGKNGASDSSRLKKLLRENSGLKDQLESLQKENDELKEDLGDSAHDAAGLKKTLKGKDGQIAELRRTNQTYSHDISGLQGANGKLEDANYDLGQKLKC
jgi:hypothetical protein